MDYKVNPKGMRDLVSSRAVGGAVGRVANSMKSNAESIAPVGKTGTYKASFETEQVEVDVKSRNRSEKRAGAILRNTAPHGWNVERNHHTMQRVSDMEV